MPEAANPFAKYQAAPQDNPFAQYQRGSPPIQQQPGLVERIANQPAVRPLVNIPRDIGQDFSAGTEMVNEGFDRLLGRDKTLGQRAIGAAEIPLGAMGQIFSPVTGAFRALLTDPVRETQLPGSHMAAETLDLGANVLAPGGYAKVGRAGLRAVEEIPAAIRASREASKAEKIANLRLGAQDARRAGYVLPPSLALQEVPTLTSMAAGAAGDTKMARIAAGKNQKITNELAARDIGLPPSEPLLPDTTAAVRRERGKVWEEVKKVVPTVKQDDAAFIDEVSAIGDDALMKEYYPRTSHDDAIQKIKDDLAESAEVPISAALEKIGVWRKEAKANFRATDDASKIKLAFAQSDAAKALENQIERQLAGTENADLLARLRENRTIIAKTHAIDAAANETTGDVNALRLAAFLDKGGLLTDGLEQIAKAGRAFPQAMREPSTFAASSNPHSALDMFVAGLTAAKHPIMAAGVMARPIARRALLSEAYQNRMIPTAPTLDETVSQVRDVNQKIMDLLKNRDPSALESAEKSQLNALQMQRDKLVGAAVAAGMKKPDIAKGLREKMDARNTP